MTSDEYGSVPSTGKLKLKGISDGRIDKKKKKKSKSKEEGRDDHIDKSVVLKKLEDDERQSDARAAKDTTRLEPAVNDEKAVGSAVTRDESELQPDATLKEKTQTEIQAQALKTESERRFEEQRRKRLEEKLKREGVKTHKQRVEELNKYLSGLSEHHDMPRIGPG